MKIVVTGANGMVGGNLVRLLADRGDDVTSLTFGDTRSLAGVRTTCVSCDLLDETAMGALVEGADLVFHLASVITLRSRRNDLAERINTEGARIVAEACRTHGVRRLIHFSSIHAFSPYPLDEAVDERRSLCDERHPFPYDRSKARGQRHVLDAVARGLDAVIVHPTGIMGPFDFGPSQAARGVIDLYRNRLAFLVGGGFNWVDVRDVSAGALAAAERGAAGENYILSGHYVSLEELGRRITVMADRKRSPRTIPLWAAKFFAPLTEAWAAWQKREPRFSAFTIHTLQHHAVVSHEKATQAFDYRPRPFEDTLRDTLEWFRQADML